MALCFSATLLTTSMSYSERWRRHQTSRLVLSFTFKIHMRGLCLVWIFNFVPSKRNESIGIDENIARHILVAVSYLFSVSLFVRDQYLIDRVDSYFDFCSNRHSTCFSYGSVSNIIIPVKFGEIRTGCEPSASYSAIMATNSSSMSGAKFVG